MADMDGDGVVDAATGQLRMQLLAGVQAAQAVIRMRAQQAEAQQRRDLEQAREIQKQLDAEHALARAEFTPVVSESWWNQAEPVDVARAYERAVAWRDVDPDARAAEERIRNEVRDRYGVDVQETAGDPVALRSAMEFADGFREDADRERQQAERDRARAVEFELEADVLEMGAENVERAEARRLAAEAGLAEEDAHLAWDSSERRDAHAVTLERAGQVEAAAAWKQADVDQARHPREAIAGRPKRAAKPRAAVAATPARQIERDGR